MTTAVDAITKHRSPHDPHAVTALSTAGSTFPARRRLVIPHLTQGPPDGFDPSDPYVRRYWVAAIGPGAVEDLMRLVTAGRRSIPISEPLYLHTLIVEGLAVCDGTDISVSDPIPPLGPKARQLLKGSLRAEHARLMLQRPASSRS